MILIDALEQTYRTGTGVIVYDVTYHFSGGRGAAARVQYVTGLDGSR